MTFYAAIKTLKEKGYNMVKWYPAFEIWTKGDEMLSIPNVPRLPVGVTKKVQAAK